MVVVIAGLLVYKNITSNTQNTEITEELTKCGQQMANENGKGVTDYEGVVIPVDFSSMPEAKLFYTRITETVKDGPNFAKHFTLVSWGCGTDCFGYSIVDTNTGAIVAYIPSNEEYHLRSSYNLDTTYFVFDPVNAGQERKYYKMIEDDKGNDRLELVCSEIAKEDIYGLPE